MFTSSGESRIC